MRAIQLSDASKNELQRRLATKAAELESERRHKTMQNTQLLGQITELRHYNKVRQIQRCVG